MTALSEIQAALKNARPVRRGRERCVLLGDSAAPAVYADMKALADATNPTIDGAFVRLTSEFKGWTIRDVDHAGVWHDVEPR